MDNHLLVSGWCFSMHKSNAKVQVVSMHNVQANLNTVLVPLLAQADKSSKSEHLQ